MSTEPQDVGTSAITVARPMSVSSLPSPDELREAWKLGTELVKTGFLPRGIDTAAKAVAVYLKGRELGLPFMMSMGNIHIVEGKPACSAELMRSLCYQRVKGFTMKTLEFTDQKCKIEFARDGSVPFVHEYTIADAQKASLSAKNNWMQHPKPMLFARCSGQGIRFYCPDGVMGMYALEELEVDPADKPLVINEYKPKDAGAATAKAAVDAALAGPTTSAAVVVEDAKPEPENPAAPAGEPDYEQEAKRILSAVTKARYDTKGGPARWENAKHELITWATRKGLAPAEIDAKAVYGFALAYQQFKAETAGEGATEAAPVVTDPAPATEVTGEGVEVGGPAGARQPEPVTTPAVPLVTAAHLIDRLTRAGKAFGVDALGRNKRPFVQPHNGAVWLVDKEILDACGWNESMNLSDAANEQFFSIIAITLTGILAKHERDNKPAPRGPSGPPVL